MSGIDNTSITWYADIVKSESKTNSDERCDFLMNALLTRKETAQKLGVSLPTLDRLIARGDLPAVRLGRSVKIHEELLDVWVKENMGKAVVL